jgi:hypothetical protein
MGERLNVYNPFCFELHSHSDRLQLPFLGSVKVWVLQAAEKLFRAVGRGFIPGVKVNQMS